MKKAIRIASVFLVMLNGPASAEDIKIAVEVEPTAEDSVGRRLVYRLKEQLAESATLRASSADEVRMKILIITLEGDAASQGSFTVYSAIWFWIAPSQPLPIYLTAMVGKCGSEQLKSCAESLLATTKDQSDSFLKLIRDSINSTKKPS